VARAGLCSLTDLEAIFAASLYPNLFPARFTLNFPTFCRLCRIESSAIRNQTCPASSFQPIAYCGMADCGAV
jgi:hypothetical protein